MRGQDRTTEGNRWLCCVCASGVGWVQERGNGSGWPPYVGSLEAGERWKDAVVENVASGENFC